MRKIALILTAALFGVNAFALTNERRIELLENAVVKLIKSNQQLKKELEEKTNELKTITTINSQMINVLENKNQKPITNFYAKVTAYQLNIRKRPSVKAKVTGKLKKGDEVKIKGAVLNKNTIWYKIDNGYISSKYTQLVYGGEINKDKIPALTFKLPKTIKKDKDINKTSSKVKLITIPPKPREKEENGTN